MVSRGTEALIIGLSKFLYVLLLTFVVYLLFSFIQMSGSPSEWPVEVRGGSALSWGLFQLLGAIVWNLNEMTDYIKLIIKDL